MRVVPRKGDVDRNILHLHKLAVAQRVVPRKGDVDRNTKTSTCRRTKRRSSPARGTWIEISYSRYFLLGSSVVPRKGDVDRNRTFGEDNFDLKSSPARGTWIEMASAERSSSGVTGRPPQGGRG